MIQSTDRPQLTTQKPEGTDRRKFMQTAAAIAGGIAVPYFIPATSLGYGRVAPSERITMAAIGCGGKGRHNTGELMKFDSVQWLAVCDVDSQHAEQDKRQVDERYGNQDCRLYSDFREVVARDDIDAVHVSTPDHWHALTTIAALRSGKDVYCEKPLANSVAESIAIRNASRETGRIVQTGSHERSNPKARIACELARTGRLGKILRIEINMPCVDEWHHKQVIEWKGIPEATAAPAHLNWDFWLGHTPVVGYHERRSHFWWRFITHFGGGEMTDRGAHIIDLAQLALGRDDSGPVTFTASGKRNEGSVYDAFMDYEFTNTYADGVQLVGRNQSPRGLKIVGEQGSIFVNVHGCELEADPPRLLESLPRVEELTIGFSPGHHQNFVDCIRSRQQPIAHAEIGCRTATICHLNNLAMSLGRTLKWDPQTESVIDDPEANRLLTPQMREPWKL